MKEIGISLGWRCTAAQLAVREGLRSRKAEGYNTCPFDIMISSYDAVVKAIDEDFKDWTNPEYMRVLKLDVNDTNNLCNIKYRVCFNHESPDEDDLYIKERWAGGKYHFINNNYEKFIERYNNRIDNFRNYLKSGIKIVFVITDIWPPNNVDSLRRAIR